MKVTQPGVSAFTELSDVPHSYLGEAEQYLAVNALETGIDFVAGGGGGAVDSVNGEVGVVVLTTGDIAEDTNANYVSDAQLIVLSNTSGTNTGDNATNTQYSSLVSNATHTGDATGATALSVVRIQGTAIPAPVAGDDQKVIKYNHGTTAFIYDTVSGGSGLTALQVFSAVSIRM